MAALRVLASVAVLLTAAVSCSTSTASFSSTLQHQATLPRVNYGGIIMAGGISSGEVLTTVEVINTNQLPPLPTALYQNTLTAVGSVLFNCGGLDDGSPGDACSTLDMEAFAPQWQHTLDLPVAMSNPTATAFGSHIWFTSDQNLLYDLDTRTGLFQTLTTPFLVTTTQCAVVSYGHTFIIGAGSDAKEVWVNTKESDPSEWKHLMDLSEPKRLTACLLFENKIFITGNRFSPYDQVTIIDLYTNELDNTSSLQTGRYGHASFVLDGRPAVAGGYNYENAEYLDSIETYDETSHTWSTEAQELTDAKAEFGAVQLLDYSN